MIYKVAAIAILAAQIAACDKNSAGGVPQDAKLASGSDSVHQPTGLGVGLASEFPTVYAGLPTQVGGACGFDTPKVDRDSQFLSGWALTSSDEPALPKSVVIGVNVNGASKFVVPNVAQREDVVNFFKNQNLLNSGFSVYVNKSEIPAGAKASVYMVIDGKVLICATNVIV